MEQEYLCSIFLVKREEKVRRTVDVSRGNRSSSRSQSEFEAEIGLIPARFHDGGEVSPSKSKIKTTQSVKF